MEVEAHLLDPIGLCTCFKGLTSSCYVLLWKEMRRMVGDMVLRSGRRWCKMIFHIGDRYYSELTLIEEAA